MGGNKNFVEGRTYWGRFSLVRDRNKKFFRWWLEEGENPPSPPVGKTLCEVVWVCPKCFLFIIIFSTFFSIHFAINLFCLHSLKTMEQQRHHACKPMKSKQKQNDHSHSNWPCIHAIVSLKDDFTVWRQTRKEDFLSIMHCLVQHDAGHGANPIVLNKKNKASTSRTLANPPSLPPPPRYVR